MDSLTFAIIYTLVVGVFLALCLALQLFDELRGDRPDRAGGGEVKSNHDGGDTI